jgi:DeoR/GlpR family transcriptional regulator of sugar metabolism
MDAQIKRTMLLSAKQRILAIDSTKFDKISFTQIGDFADIDMIVTDKKISETWEKIFISHNIEVVYTKELESK